MQIPWWLLVSFGAYSLGSLGLGLLKFRDCPEAYEELLVVSPRAFGFPVDGADGRESTGDITGEEPATRSGCLGGLDCEMYGPRHRDRRLIYKGIYFDIRPGSSISIHLGQFHDLRISVNFRVPDRYPHTAFPNSIQQANSMPRLPWLIHHY